MSNGDENGRRLHVRPELAHGVEWLAFVRCAWLVRRVDDADQVVHYYLPIKAMLQGSSSGRARSDGEWLDHQLRTNVLGGTDSRLYRIMASSMSTD